MPACAVAYALTRADAYAPAHEHCEHLIAQLHSPEVHQMTHSELEGLLGFEGRALLRRLFQAHVDERSPGIAAAPVLDAEDHPCLPQRCHTRHLMTPFGAVEIVRMGYGRPSAPSLHPLDATLHLPPERYSHSVRQRGAVEAAKKAFDDVVATLTTTTGAHVPKRQAEQLVVRAAQDFEVFYATQRCATPEEVQETSAVVVLSVDGKGVPMRKADLQAATRQAVEAHRAPRGSRSLQSERNHTKRMATVATVYTIAPWVRTPADILRELRPAHLTATARPRPAAKRVWASLAQPLADVIQQAFEAAKRRAPQRTKQWVALVDGTPTQLRLLSEAAAEYGVALRVVLDLIHVLGYLWPAATALSPTAPLEAETWVTTRLGHLLRGRSRQGIAHLRRTATARRLTETQRAPVEQCAHYLSKYADFLHYDAYWAAGFPIATGVIEGACRHLVKDRMEVTGARWSLTGAEAVLRLRSLWSSGDFEAYWQFHLAQECKRHHAVRYAKANVPTRTLPVRGQGRGSHLQLVK